LIGVVGLLGLYAFLQRQRVGAWWLYVPIGLTAWVLVHESGVHPTVVGIAFGFLTRVRHDDGEHESPAERLEHRLRPVSAMLCVPLFALFAAGVTVSADSLRAAFTEPVALGIVLGLLVGKTVGVLGGTYVTARFTRAELNEDLAWSDVAGVAVLAGIGFTVSLLIGELAFGSDDAAAELAKTAVLIGSVAAALTAAVVLGRRNAVYRRIEEEDSRDSDRDGIADPAPAGSAEPDPH